MEAIADFLKPLLEAYGGEYGWAVTVLTYIGTFRVIFKPLMTGIEGVIAATPSKEDDKKLAEIKEHKAYKFVVWLVDFLGSIKLKEVKQVVKK